MLYKIIEAPAVTDYGAFNEVVYTDGKYTSICLSYGDPYNAEVLYVRIHSDCISSHVFYNTGCDCREQMAKSQEYIVEKKCGIIIWLDQEGRSNGHVAKVASESWKAKGLSQSEAYVAAGYNPDARDYSLAIKIIRSLNPRSIVLLTSNKQKVEAIKKVGVKVQSRSI